MTDWPEVYRNGKCTMIKWDLSQKYDWHLKISYYNSPHKQKELEIPCIYACSRNTTDIGSISEGEHSAAIHDFKTSKETRMMGISSVC